MERYAIRVDEKPCPFDRIMIKELAKKISKISKKPLYDISHQLRYGVGIFFAGIEKNFAEQIQEAFFQHQIPCQIIPFDTIPNLARPRRFFHAKIHDLYLEIEAPFHHGILWQTIRLLSLGIVKDYSIDFLEKEEFKLLTYTKEDGYSRNLLKNKILEPSMVEEDFSDPDRECESFQYCLDIFEQDSRFRISAKTFCYDLLGENRTPSSRNNFLLLLDIFKTRACNAKITDTLDIFLENKRASSDLIFHHEDMYSKYLQWYELWLTS